MSYLDRRTQLLDEFIFSNYEPPPLAEWRPYDHIFAAYKAIASKWSPATREHALHCLMRDFESNPETLPEIHALAELVCQDVASEMHGKLSRG